MKKALLFSARLVASLFPVLLIVICVFSVSPIFNFSRPQPFSGPDIYNPYEGLDTASRWKRANFHTHTRVDNILNECPEYPSVVLEDYRKLGYDILAFSNHNLLTPHPADSSLQINVYEHGINLFKFHKLVFNPDRMLLYDHLLPFLVSQQQWQFDYLSRNADFIVMNHPDRERGASTRSMRLLTGYRLIEADCGASTGLLRWDEALSAGHYSHCLINDDCHDSGDHAKIALRCSWLQTPTARYEDIKPVLLKGCFYSMRVPDFGCGDWEVKYRENARLPQIRDIGVRGDTTFLRLSAPARIEAWGQDHTLLAKTEGTQLEYTMKPNDSYVRYAAFFSNGVVIYTNAFARYDATETETPYRESPHTVNYLLTALFNLSLLAVVLLCCLWLRRLWPHKKPEA
ncbi:MAG: hypothetical protein J5640_00505 [Bacteroidales bacterium]|nr:hypothetical protein [Bacteroidales bacterium]